MAENILKFLICSQLELGKESSTGINVLCFYTTLLVIKLLDHQLYITSYIRVWMLSVSNLIYQLITSERVSQSFHFHHHGSENMFVSCLNLSVNIVLSGIYAQ